MRHRVLRNVAVAAALAAAIGGCSEPTVPVGQVDNVEGFVGLVAAEEPRSALIGRDALSARRKRR